MDLWASPTTTREPPELKSSEEIQIKTGYKCRGQCLEGTVQDLKKKTEPIGGFPWTNQV